MIKARGITKSFRKHKALNNFDLTVEKGQVHGFLGPNGAGKSTTMRALLGQITIDQGELTVFGMDPWKDAVEIHRNLAYVPGDVVLWPNLTGGQCLDLLAKFHGRRNEQRQRELIDRFQLDVTKKARSYSKGNRQKVALVSALSMDVDLYIFDEPTSGLDPLMESTFQKAVRERVANGATVLLSSHILDEVEALCSHVTIVRAGTTVATGSLDELRASSSSTIVATFESIPTELADAAQDHTHIEVTVPRAEANKRVAAIAAHDPTTLIVRPPTLDELFHQHYQEQP